MAKSGKKSDLKSSAPSADGGSAILDELVKATATKQRAGEPAQVYARRLSLAVNKFKDDDWARLSDPAQKWVNAAIEVGDAIEQAAERGEAIDDEIVVLPGMRDAAPAPRVEHVADEESDEGEESDESEESDSGEEESDAGAARSPAPVVPAGKKKAGKKSAGKKSTGEDPAAVAADPAPTKSGKKSTAAARAPTAAPGGRKSPGAGTKSKSAAESVATSYRSASSEPRTGTKRAKMNDRISRSKGATISEISESLGWQPHTTRAAISIHGRSAKITSAQDGKRGRVYRIEV